MQLHPVFLFYSQGTHHRQSLGKRAAKTAPRKHSQCCTDTKPTPTKIVMDGTAAFSLVAISYWHQALKEGRQRRPDHFLAQQQGMRSAERTTSRSTETSSRRKRTDHIPVDLTGSGDGKIPGANFPTKMSASAPNTIELA